jgi:hypothetical protein
VWSPPSLEQTVPSEPFNSVSAACDNDAYRSNDLILQSLSLIITTVISLRPNNTKMPNVVCARSRGGFCAYLDELHAVLDPKNIEIFCITKTWYISSSVAELSEVDRLHIVTETGGSDRHG